MAHRHARVVRTRDAYRRELAPSKQAAQRVGERHRRERERLSANSPHEQLLVARSERVRPLALAFMQLAKEERLVRPLESVLESLVHMTFIRLFPVAPRWHEWLAHEHLTRLYETSLARREHP
jgi:hypothetical protein